MLKNKKNITSSLLFFSRLLNKVWKDANDEIEKSSMDEDEKEIIFRAYIQVSWELLVERLICKEKHFIDVYSDGADLYDLSERITFSDADDNIHQVIFIVKNNSKNLLNNLSTSEKSIFNFDKFVSMEDDYYYNEEPPFNKVLGRTVEEDEQGIFNLKDVEFYLV